MGENTIKGIIVPIYEVGTYCVNVQFPEFDKYIMVA